MKKTAIWWGVSTALVVGVVAPAIARPGYLGAFKAHYNTAAGKTTLNGANCGLCHVGQPNAAKWNVYGEAMRADLGAAKGVNNERAIAAFKAIEGKTNPVTKQTFLAMIQGDRLPGSTIAAGETGSSASVGGGPWEPVFNNVNMDGLTKVNEGNYVIQDGVLKYTGGGRGFLRSNKQYGNYSMVIAWRFTGAAAGSSSDAGIFLKARSGDNGNPFPNSPQLMMGPNQNFGNIGGTTGGRDRFDLIKPNDWNIYSITVENGLATLAINGTVAWDTAVGQNGNLSGDAFVALQHENFPFEIAQWWIKPL